MPQYEVVVVLDTAATEEEQTSEVTKIEELITSNGGQVLGREVWGKRRLAYMIGRKREGYYVLVNFQTATNNQVLAEVNRYLRISERIIRSLVTVAVVGKSKGNVLSPEEITRLSMARPSNRRPMRGDGDMEGGPRGDRGPRADAGMGAR